MTYGFDLVHEAQLKQAGRQIEEARLRASSLQKALGYSDRFRGLSRPVLDAVADLGLVYDGFGAFFCAFRAQGCEATSGGVPAGLLDEDEWDQPHSPLCPVTLARKLRALPADLQGVIELERETAEARNDH